MDGAWARAIDGVTATLRRRNARWCRDGDGRPVVFDDIEIEEEEIAREYDEGALPLVAMVVGGDSLLTPFPSALASRRTALTAPQTTLLFSLLLLVIRTDNTQQ